MDLGKPFIGQLLGYRVRYGHTLAHAAAVNIEGSRAVRVRALCGGVDGVMYVDLTLEPDADGNRWTPEAETWRAGKVWEETPQGIRQRIDNEPGRLPCPRCRTRLDRIIAKETAA